MSIGERARFFSYRSIAENVAPDEEMRFDAPRSVGCAAEDGRIAAGSERDGAFGRDPLGVTEKDLSRTIRRLSS